MMPIFLKLKNKEHLNQNLQHKSHKWASLLEMGFNSQKKIMSKSSRMFQHMEKIPHKLTNVKRLSNLISFTKLKILQFHKYAKWTAMMNIEVLPPNFKKICSLVSITGQKLKLQLFFPLVLITQYKMIPKDKIDTITRKKQ